MHTYHSRFIPDRVVDTRSRYSHTPIFYQNDLAINILQTFTQPHLVVITNQNSMKIRTEFI
jgi:hypothetical protein